LQWSGLCRGAPAAPLKSKDARAKVFHDAVRLGDLLVFAWNSRKSVRNEVLVLLSIKAGLRAGEIAGLDWDMVLTPSGDIGDVLEVRDSIAKKQSGRRIPLHPDLCKALARWHSERSTSGPIIVSSRGARMHPVSIVNWFAKAYRAIGLAGCSSHSGRRTFITRAARMVHKAGGSLRDVQLLAGHRSIQTTQSYIDGDSDAQRRLVRLI
jgi:integrase/recombinase XerD